ncbi:hypothetical protein BVI2075_280011 [Burkholderia vietnamiensis]|nr:hypothetical protein BVI2075_280011 [Burkholderia vietnamiensis]
MEIASSIGIEGQRDLDSKPADAAGLERDSYLSRRAFRTDARHPDRMAFAEADGALEPSQPIPSRVMT